MRIAQNRRMGKKKFNFCMKCGFRHASPTGKGCSAGASEQLKEQIRDDKSIQGEQGPNLEGLDAVEDRMATIEGKVTALDAKVYFNVIIMIIVL